MFRVLPLVLFLIIAGCSAKPVPPRLGVYTFEELNYPCVKVEFPDQIKLRDTTLEQRGSDVAVVYDLDMPGYKIQVVKLYSLETGWSLDPLSSLKTTASKFYEIYSDEAPDKSAVISVEDLEGSLYLKGSIAEFIQNDKAVRVDVFRRIKKFGSFKRDNIESWKNSNTGLRTIENMKNIVNYVYSNINSTECPYRGSVDMDWWH